MPYRLYCIAASSCAHVNILLRVVIMLYHAVLHVYCAGAAASVEAGH
jgi:hypothetical protein